LTIGNQWKKLVISNQQLVISNQWLAITLINQILSNLIKLYLMITLSIFIHFRRKYHYLNPLIETNLMNTKSLKSDYPLSKYLKNSLITINMYYINPN